MPRKAVKPRPKNAKLAKLLQAKNTAPDDDLYLYDVEEVNSNEEVEKEEAIEPKQEAPKDNNELIEIKKELEQLKKQLEDDRKAREERKKQLLEIKATKELARENRKKEKEQEAIEHKKYLESLLLRGKKEAVEQVNQQWKSQLTSARINNLKF